MMTAKMKAREQMGRGMKSKKLLVENSVPSGKETYTCIAPEEGLFVFKYFNSFLSEEKARRFEEHLLLCFKCQDIIFELDELFEMLQLYRDELFENAGQEEENMSSRACVNSHN